MNSSAASCSTVIRSMQAWEALDSRGRPTVAVRLSLADGASAVARVPAGASTGTHEARELRDGGQRYSGRGVRRAVSNINTVLAESMRGIDVAAGGAVDDALRRLDGSVGFAALGANAVLAVSVAAAQACAAAYGVSLARYFSPEGPLLLPMPRVNVISGGAHAAGLIDIQDVLIVPVAATCMAEALEWSVRVRDATEQVATKRGYREASLAADEGGLGLELASNRAALDLVIEGITAANLVPGSQVSIALDIAANELSTDGGYELVREGRKLPAAEWVDEVVRWCETYPIVSVEDILAEDDWDAWASATRALGNNVELVGDDLFVTDPGRIDRGIGASVANAVLVKPNQNGLLSGTRDALLRAQAAGYATVASARSGDTEDSWLTDLAVGWRAGQIKVGSTRRSERVAKWNRLLEFEALDDTELARPFRPEATTSNSESQGGITDGQV